jgi:DNA end-binding protein Ku
MAQCDGLRPMLLVMISGKTCSSFGAFMTVCEISRNDALQRVEALLKTGRDPGHESGAAAPLRPPHPLYAKGHHVLVRPEELDELKLEAKHIIDMVRFVDQAEIDSRYFEKPYYLVPDGYEADEGYIVIRDALKETGKVAIGQLIMHGREHLVGIKASGRGLALYILRYANELREPTRYFEDITAEPDPQAVKLAAELIKRERGRFQPEKMPDRYVAAVRELIQAKVENRAPEVVVAAEGKPETAVINIMDALKESMEAKGRVKIRGAVRKAIGKAPDEAQTPRAARARAATRRTAH